MSTNTDDGSEPYRIDLDASGGAGSLLVSSYDDDDALSHIQQQLRSSTDTPTPAATARRRGSDKGGPIQRVTDANSIFGIQGLRTFALQSHELGDAIRTRRDELYRNEFPRLKPRFTTKCIDCQSEFDEERDECPNCGSTDLRKPDPEEKREAEELFESINREGQSLRELAKYAEPDQWTAGVSTLVIQYEYTIARDSGVYPDGTVIDKQPKEVVYGDPASIVPVVDENNRIGGYWFTCPLHRENALVEDPDGGPTACPKCGAERQPVYFYEKRRGEQADRYYFRDEVLTWAYPMPRLSGLDGLAPASNVVVRQVILEMMNRYAAAFYDQDSDRLPNQLMILHTTNADHWEEQIRRSRDDDDPYDSPILANEYSPQDESTPELQVVDAMPDELRGQSEAIKKTYKEDIRQAIGISNVHDSDLQDAGGLNNEGLQLEVTDRSIASQQHDYVEGWLDTLAKRLGIEDWYIGFLPARDLDTEEKQKRVKTGQLAAKAGLDARWEDGEVSIADGEFEAPENPGPDPGGGGAPMGMADDQGNPRADDATTQQAADLSDRDAAAILEEAFRHIVWADDPEATPTEQQARPFWTRDEDVPEQVQKYVRSAVAQADLSLADDVSTGQLRRYFREKLTQRQGWSLQSLTDGLVYEHNFEREYASTVARSGAARILNRAKLMAYQDLEEGADPEKVLYYWRGPSDESTTEACEELKERTNPEYGGEPLPWEEFTDVQREVHEEHFPDLRFDETALHPNERHTFEATIESDVAS